MKLQKTICHDYAAILVRCGFGNSYWEWWISYWKWCFLKYKNRRSGRRTPWSVWAPPLGGSSSGNSAAPRTATSRSVSGWETMMPSRDLTTFLWWKTNDSLHTSHPSFVLLWNPRWNSCFLMKSMILGLLWTGSTQNSPKIAPKWRISY